MSGAVDMDAFVTILRNDRVAVDNSQRSLKALNWKLYENGQAHVLIARLTEEDEGGYSSYAARLPGVISQGETIDEAVRNTEDAFRAVIASYREHGEAIPWQDLPPKAPDEIERWVVVDVG